MTSRALAVVLVLGVVGVGCSRPVPVRPEGAAPAEQPAARGAESPTDPTAAKPAPACPPCECEACPTCPAAAEAAPAPEPVPVPEHLRPTPEQCKGACDRMMELEVRRATNRVQGAQPQLMAALKKGLDEEKALLSDACVKRCTAEFTQATALCVRKFEDLDRVRQCVVEASFPSK